jgi:hypothetical protein
LIIVAALTLLTIPLGFMLAVIAKLAILLVFPIFLLIVRFPAPEEIRIIRALLHTQRRT